MIPNLKPGRDILVVERRTFGDRTTIVAPYTAKWSSSRLLRDYKLPGIGLVTPRIPMNTKSKKRAIVVRFELTKEQKAKLRTVAKDAGFKSIRSLLYERALSDILWEKRDEPDDDRRDRIQNCST